MSTSKYILTAFLLFFTIFLCAPETQAQDFEGTIHYQFPEAKNSKMNEIAYMIKDAKVRMQFGQGNSAAAMLYLPKDSKMIVLIDKMKGYMEMNMDDKEMGDAYTDKWENSKMNKTGTTKTIAGHSCEIWEVNNNKGDQIRMCMAQGLGTFISPGNPMMKQQAPA